MTSTEVDVLSPEALAFVERLHRELNPERERLLALREERRGEHEPEQCELNDGSAHARLR